MLLFFDTPIDGFHKLRFSKRRYAGLLGIFPHGNISTGIHCYVQLLRHASQGMDFFEFTALPLNHLGRHTYIRKHVVNLGCAGEHSITCFGWVVLLPQ